MDASLICEPLSHDGQLQQLNIYGLALFFFFPSLEMQVAATL